MSNIADAAQILLKDYNQALIDHEYGITRSQLLKLDKIDLRNILTYDNDRKSSLPNFKKMEFNHDLLAKNYWYCFIPCFSSGVFQLNTARYIKFDIKDIDIINRSYIVTIQDYLWQTSFWEVGIKTTAELKFPVIEYETLKNPETWTYVDINVIENNSYKDIYRLIPYETLQWTEAQMQFWKDKILKHSQTTEEKMYENVDSGKNAIYIFLLATVLSNELLQQYKPKAERKSGTKKSINTKNESKPETPKKIVRTIGPISIKSAKPPKPSTKETVIKYKTPVWKARGGVRHMKDGRVIPFKESIHRRKCLIDDNTNTTIPQTILKLKNKGVKNNAEKEETDHT